MNLWYDQQKKEYVMKAKEVPRCKFCNGNMETSCILYRGWNRREKDEFVFCAECVPNFHMKTPSRLYWESRIVMIKSIIPDHSTLVVSSPPQLRDAAPGLTVYDVEDIKSEHTVDKTVHAGRLSVEGAQIGRIEHYEDKQISNLKELDKLFDEHLKAMPLLGDLMPDEMPKEITINGEKKIISKGKGGQK